VNFRTAIGDINTTIKTFWLVCEKKKKKNILGHVVPFSVIALKIQT